MKRDAFNALVVDPPVCESLFLSNACHGSVPDRGGSFRVIAVVCLSCLVVGFVWGFAVAFLLGVAI